VLRQLRLNHFQHPWVGQQIEKMVGIGILRARFKINSHFPRQESVVPLWKGCMVFN
jgi:hypothetical protein